MNIKIYTINNCIFCKLAKDLLKKNNIKYDETIINNDNIFEELKEKTKHKTLPQIFINEKFIGGYMELKKIIENNRIAY